MVNASRLQEHLYECLLPFMKGKGALNDAGVECKLTADEGIEGCPDYGKLEFQPRLKDLSILMDSAPSHLPSNHVRVTAFHKYA